MKVEPEIMNIKACGVSLNFCDFGGQRSIREYWHYFFEDADFIIYVVDASDEARIEESKECFQDLLKEEKLKMFLF